MMVEQFTNRLAKESWIALWLVVFSTLLYGITVFQHDYFRELNRGEAGSAAIKKLDQMRRPLLDLKKAEVHLLQSGGDRSSIPDIENAILDGRQMLSEYLMIASYNKELRKKVVQFKTSYEAWVSLELELVSKRELIEADSEMWVKHAELDALTHRNAAAFLEVMDVLGSGETPIHDDIAAGATASNGLLVNSLAFIAYLISVAVWQGWAKNRRERQHYESEIKLHRLVHMDSLTGIANRILLDDRISVAIASARRYGHHLGILYLDLDGFKKVNDEQGHDAGDAVLKEVASRLQKNTRQMDTVARIGGDEFVVLMTGLGDTAEVHVWAEKLRAILNQPLELSGKPYTPRASIGIAIYPDDGEQPMQLLKHADAAMYEAKRLNKLQDTHLRTK